VYNYKKSFIFGEDVTKSVFHLYLSTMNDANYKLTTVKVLSENYSEFKMKALNSDMTLQKLVNRAIHLYLSDADFKKQLNEAAPITNNQKY